MSFYFKKLPTKYLFPIVLAALTFGVVISRAVIMSMVEVDIPGPRLSPEADLNVVVDISCDANLQGGKCRRSVRRISDYCSNSDTYFGYEGYLPGLGSKEWTLKHVLFSIRHGDRTTLNMINGAVDLDRVDAMEFFGGASLLSPTARNHVHRLSSFVLKDIDGGKIDKLVDTVNSSNIFQVSDRFLDPGMLTSRGYLQHSRLGRYMNVAYEDFLNKLENPWDVYIRSTKYARTIQVHLFCDCHIIYFLLVHVIHSSIFHFLFFLFSSRRLHLQQQWFLCLEAQSKMDKFLFMFI